MSDKEFVNYKCTTPEGEQLLTLTKPIKGLQAKPRWIRFLLALVFFGMGLPTLLGLFTFWFIKAKLHPTGGFSDAFFVPLGGSKPVVDAKKDKTVQKRTSTTAQATAVFRYTATLSNCCDDALARYFLPWDLIVFAYAFSLVHMLRSKPKLGYVPCRTIALDTFVLQSKPKQVILLAAGFDTRAHRLLVSGAQFFEVDIAATQEYKLEIIKAHPKQFTNTSVEYASVDFSKETAFEVLKRSAKFDSNCKDTIVIMEGLSYYLSFGEFRKTLLDIHSNVPSGTRVMFDCFEDVWSTEENRAKDRGTETKSLALRVAAMGEPFKFGLRTNETASAIFGPLGFKVLAHIGPNEIQHRFCGGGPGTHGAAHLIILEV